MDTRWLQDFLVLAEVKSFTKAADIRNLSQAAFSRRIQAIEQWLGTQLIDRNAFPTALTAAGERFRETATDVVNRLAASRSQLRSSPDRNHVRIALPHALATTRLHEWWKTWSKGHDLSCSLELGNIHDTVSSLTSGSADLLVCFEHEELPIRLREGRYEKLHLGTERVKPYASPLEVDGGRIAFPGDDDLPVPLLTYSPTTLFSRVVEIAKRDNPSITGYSVFESESSDVLGDLASSGYGVVWLADSSFRQGREWKLVPVGEGRWDVQISINAYKARDTRRPGLEDLWNAIRDSSALTAQG